jgi:hypothetical protein
MISKNMINRKIIQYIKKEWEKQGMCSSCGWHDLLQKYDLDSDFPDWEIEESWIWLPCHNSISDGCRGVKIYFKNQWSEE